MEETQANRLPNFDLLRIIAAFSVILIHVNWKFFGKVYDTPSDNLEWIVGALINLLTRFSVPAFVMMSGAFILQNSNNADPVTFYKKVLVKIFAPSCVAIVLLIPVRMCLNVWMNKNYLSGLRGILTGGFFNLWYIYMLVGLYLLTPFMIKLRAILVWKQYKFAAIILMIWAVISQAFSSYELAYSIGVVFSFLAYYLIGDIIRNEAKRIGSLNLFMICVACITIGYLFRKAGYNYYTSSAFTNFFSPVIVIYSICVFKFFSQLRCYRNFNRISGITFEIYLFHSAVLELFMIIDTKVNIKIGLLSKEIIIYILTCMASICMAIIFKAIWKKMIVRI